MEIPSEEQFSDIFGLIEKIDAVPESERPAFIDQLCASGEPTGVVSYVRLYYSLPAPPESEFLAGDRIADHYTVREKVDVGGMGIVYRAEQDLTHRDVAIKLIHPRLFTPALLQRFAEEIATLGKLDHPNIVRIFDADRTRPGDRIPDTVFIAMQLVEGKGLAQHLAGSTSPQQELVRIMAAVCDGLHYAHERGVIHRDIKPSNILVRADGVPVILDFGISLGERSFGDESESVAGTPGYMSPEVARAEGHLVDGRSDIFSAGVVLYQFLAGKHPFPPGPEILERTTTVTPPPPGERTGQISTPELDRICMKALSKRASDRYQNAQLFAADLRLCLAEPAPLTTTSPGAEAAPKPKGLRAFAAEDAELFLTLLPGPKDRCGLPESLAFWKNGISSRERGVAFRVGVIYGPSGSGKSSLLNAGILPRLDPSITAILLDGDKRQLEADLLVACVPLLPDGATASTPAACLGQIRQAADGHKTLIVIDQFEQWLHTWDGRNNTALVEALRQCDGTSVQCVLIVRDEFWRPVTQFLGALEVDLRPSYNAALVDLFEIEHATKVLRSLGHASGKLPSADERTLEHEKFVQEVIDGLQANGQVVPVHLALFCQMFERHPWNSGELQKVGGISGLGMRFLDEVLENPGNDADLKATIAAILASILPADDSSIRSSARSLPELARAADCSPNSPAFNDAISLLDHRYRLLTPVAGTAGQDSQPAFKLTHDYLVPTIRDWFLARRRATHRGRAQLQLDHLAATWAKKPVRRNRPSFLEWLQLLIFTKRSRWTDPQRRMMRQSTMVRVSAISAIAALAFLGIREYRGRIAGSETSLALLSARTENVGEYLPKLRKVKRWARPQLLKAIAAHDAFDPKYLHAHLALLPEEPERLDAIWDTLHRVPPGEFGAIYDAILAAGKEVDAAVNARIANAVGERRLTLLKAYRDPQDPALNQPLADWVTAQPLDQQPGWAKLFARRGNAIAPLLVEILESRPEAEAEHSEDGVALSDRYRRRAAAAILLKHLGQTEKFWTTFLDPIDLGPSSILVEAATQIFPDPQELTARLALEKDAIPKRTLVLALSEYDLRDLAKPQATRLVAAVREQVRPDFDYAIVGTSRWCLRHWGLPSDDRVPFDPRRIRAGWYDSAEETMVVVRAGDLAPFAFAIADKEVSVGQWRQFNQRNPAGFNPSDDLPAKGVRNHKVREYCNWRTRVEIGADQIFYEERRRPDGSIEYVINDAFSAGKTGYRLPTPEEYLAACGWDRASPNWQLVSPDVLGEYAWTATNALGVRRPVGSLKPNHFGLHDLQGNVEEWTENAEGKNQRNLTGFLCGHSMLSIQPYAPGGPPKSIMALGSEIGTAGFRLARTLPPPPDAPSLKP